MKCSILIIEDEEAISELIALNLSMAGYAVKQAYDGIEGKKYFDNSAFDLIILDVMLPEIDGLTLLADFVKKETPVLLLTAKNSISDKVKGLNLGADDYMTKPFDNMELLARINALLRRSKKTEQELSFDNIVINKEKRMIQKGDIIIELTMKEFDLLMYLFNNNGIALSRDVILENVWGYGFLGGTRTVDMHVKKIREKLNTSRIKTIYKIGYMMEL